MTRDELIATAFAACKAIVRGGGQLSPEARELASAVVLELAEQADRERAAARERKRKQRACGTVVSATAWEAARAAVLESDDWTCAYCGADLRNGVAHVDHVLPRSRGGADDLGNLVAACAPCNLSKGARTPEEWRS